MTTTAHPTTGATMNVTGKPIVYGTSHPKPNPKTDAIVAEVRTYALANTDQPGWEVVAKLWEDTDIAEAIGWAESLKGAIKKIRPLVVTSPKPAATRKPAAKLATVTPIAGKATRDPVTGMVYANQVEDPKDEDIAPPPAAITSTVTVKPWLNQAVAPQACTDIDFAAHWAAIEAMK
jgi:hypothetical protein